MNKCQRPQTLVHVEFYFQDGHLLFYFYVGAGTTVEVLGDEFQDEVKIDFTLLLLFAQGRGTFSPGE
jgi:hypothetical protein